MEKTDKGPKIYLGVDKKERLELEGGQFIEYKMLNAGEKSRYQQKVRSRIYTKRDNQDEMAIDVFVDDVELAAMCITDFMLFEVNSAGQTEEIKLTSTNQGKEIINKLDTETLGKLIEGIRELNPFLRVTRKKEDIQKDIDRLEKELKELDEKSKK